VKLTNPLEILAFFLSQVVRIAAQYGLAWLVLTALYGKLVHAGAAMLIAPISIAVGTVFWAAVLPLFLVLRMALGGVPEVVAGPDRRHSFTSSGGEIGAYALAYLIELILSWLLNILVMGLIYVALRTAGHTMLILPVTVTISAAFAAIFFLLFIALRRAFSGSTAGVVRTPTVQR
jgi:hypothetical protein